MRSVLCIVLSVFLFLLPVSAYPGYGQDIDARADEVVDYHWPKPSGTHHWKREPYPSPKPGHPHEYKKRAEQETVVTPPHDGDFSRDLCPYGMTACPINAVQGHTCSKPTSLLDWIREGFECTDVQVDLNSCGGCGSVDRRCVLRPSYP
ncbi:hypothetical protein NLI96_g12799 [Meripilus lineatus]|uniref:Uncharacterized protein n=1 Tax=Meripilus lineatus TaxID=2056292 RepID=A0AAD5UP75_9APHY|nr:hypothetical protein NLI96_g12799 [Physisporinus lineatus]